MKMPATFKQAAYPLFLWLAFFAPDAHADIKNTSLLDNVLSSYATAASTWATTITVHATWLFWTLALISMVWTFGMMALRKADIGEFFGEFVRFTVFTGFFWWLLINGPNFAMSIMDSLRKIGGTASGTGPDLTPSGVVDIGFDIFTKVLVKSTLWSPISSATGILISIAILIVLALIGVNMLLLLISGWILAYAGIFFLGFGGSRWTSDMAIHYFKTVLSIAAQLFTMVLLVGIGKSFIDLYYTNMNTNMKINELGVMLVVAVVLLALVNKVPPLIGHLAMGGGTGSLGHGFGAGAVAGAAAMGAAAAATAGASFMSGLANTGGGAQALMAAFSKANAAESASGGMSDFMAPASGSNSGQAGSGGGSALASAMAGGSSSSFSEMGNLGGSDQAGASNGNDSKAGAGQNSKAKDTSKGATDANRSQGSTARSNSSAKSPGPQGGISFGSDNLSGSVASSSNSGGDSAGGEPQNLSGAFSDAKNADFGTDWQSGAASANPGAKSSAAPDANAPGKVSSNNPFSAAGAAAAKIGRVTAGTAANLVQGTWDVTKAKGNEMIDAAMDRIGDTPGGKIATAIKARDTAPKPNASMPSTSDGYKTTTGTAADAASEVAAFRDRTPPESS